MADAQAMQAEVEEFAAKLDIACCRFNNEGNFAFGSETWFPASFGFQLGLPLQSLDVAQHN